MPIPNTRQLLRPVLESLKDDGEHKVEEVRELMRVLFDVTPKELAITNSTGTSVFVNHVAWALAHLNMTTGPLGHRAAITRLKEGAYKINDYGKALLRNHQGELTIADLRT